MLRYSSRSKRHMPSCSCLVDALRTYPAQADHYTGCAAPDCPLKGLDGSTLHQFLEAIAGSQDVGGGEANVRARNGKQIGLFRSMARRYRRPSSG
jgi:hypothetical protein